jgi:hypothetical protein
VPYNPPDSEERHGPEQAGLPMEVGRMVGFLASGFSSYVTRVNIVVNGGTR